MYFGDWLSRWNVYSPQKVALVDYALPEGSRAAYTQPQEYTYAELYRRSNRVAHFLKSRGVGRGDRVAILAQNSIEHIDLFFATGKLGAMLVPLNYRLAFSGLQYILTDTSPAVFFSSQEFEETAKSLARMNACPEPLSLETELAAVLKDGDASPPEEIRVQQTDPHLILYTSGTTGHPKGALITHGQITWNSINTAISLSLTKDDRGTIHTPIYHTGGLNVLATPLFHFGGQVVLLRRWDSEAFLDIIEKHRLTLFFGLPTLFKMMMASPKFNTTDFSSVRVVLSGGEPCPRSILDAFAERGMPIRQGYGLTEVGPNVYSLPAEDAVRKAGSVGFPNFHVDARIVDERMHDVPRGQVGELVMAGPMVCGGYWQKPQATAEAIVDGWFRTGDLFRQDEEGYYYVVGRKKDMYISGGENVYPVEVENVLHQHPAILEAAVIGVPDEKWGEVGKAFVVLRPGQSAGAGELSNFLSKHLAKYQIPKHYVFMESLPKGDTGKILKKELAAIDHA